MKNNVEELLSRSVMLTLLGVQVLMASFATNARLTEENYNLLLAGGALKTCSSMSSRHCKTKQWDDNHKTHQLFKITPESIAAFTQSPVFQALSDNHKKIFHALFTDFYAEPGSTVASVRELAEQLNQARTNTLSDQHPENKESTDAIEFIRSLPDPVYYGFQDFFEIRNPLPEGVALEDNKSPLITEIYTEFLRQAHKKHLLEGNKPDAPVKIGVLTASARDSLSVAGYYQSVFESAATLAFPDVAFEVTWIPLDISLAQVLRQKAKGHSSCQELEAVRASHLSFNRLSVYPDEISRQQQLCQNPAKLEAMFSQLSGLFINGGDQNRTRSALLNPDGSDTIWLHIIKSRLQQNHLILGGTSAGTAVQSGGISNNRPVPMITSGDTMTAFFRGAFALPPPPYGCEKTANCPNGLLETDLTYNPRGGLSTFSAGIVDTHFSERDRQGRLALLAAATKTPLAFGVDEGTALLVNTTNPQKFDMKVMGEGGVFILSIKNGIYKSQAQKHQLVGMSHYLTHGDQLKLSKENGEFEFFFSPTKELLDSHADMSTDTRGRWRQETTKMCGQQQFHRWHEDDIAFLVNPGDETVFYRPKEQKGGHCAYANLLFGIEN